MRKTIEKRCLWPNLRLKKCFFLEGEGEKETGAGKEE